MTLVINFFEKQCLQAKQPAYNKKKPGCCNILAESYNFGLSRGLTCSKVRKIFENRLTLLLFAELKGVYFFFFKKSANSVTTKVRMLTVKIPKAIIRLIASNVDMSITPFLTGMSQTALDKLYDVYYT